MECIQSGHEILFHMSSWRGWLLRFSELSQRCLPFPTGMSMVCSPPDPVPTPSCLSWLAGMVKTVCWELEPPEWIFSMPADKIQWIPDDELLAAGPELDLLKHTKSLNIVYMFFIYFPKSFNYPIFFFFFGLLYYLYFCLWEWVV